MTWTFYDQVVKVEKGWVEQEFVLLIIAALPNETGLPNEQISYRIQSLWVRPDPIRQKDLSGAPLAQALAALIKKPKKLPEPNVLAYFISARQ